MKPFAIKIVYHRLAQDTDRTDAYPELQLPLNRDTLKIVEAAIKKHENEQLVKADAGTPPHPDCFYSGGCGCLRVNVLALYSGKSLKKTLPNRDTK